MRWQSDVAVKLCSWSHEYGHPSTVDVILLWETRKENFPDFKCNLKSHVAFNSKRKPQNYYNCGTWRFYYLDYYFITLAAFLIPGWGEPRLEIESWSSAEVFVYQFIRLIVVQTYLLIKCCLSEDKFK